MFTLLLTSSIQIILFSSFFIFVYCSVKQKQLLVYHSFDAVRFDDNAVCNDGTRGGTENYNK
jgi:hypothetical protein